MVPFIAGLAIGGVAVFAFSNKNKLSEAAQKGYEKSKEVAGDIKKGAVSTVECIKSNLEGEKKEVKKAPVKQAKVKEAT